MRRRELLRGAALVAVALVAPEVAWGRRLSARGKVQRHNREVLAGLFVGPKQHRFDGIVVHHTATASASLEGIGRYHRKRFGDPLGIQYHFLIDNGKRDHPPGWIHVGRWRHHLPAIHLFKPEKAVESVAICLIGNFEEKRPRTRQVEALVDLSQALVDHYRIDLAQVRTHTGVDGRLTQCPGKHFPLERFRARLRSSPGR